MMFLAAAVGGLVAAAEPAPVNTVSLSDAAKAIEAGRLDQARLMISRAMVQGAAASEVDPLLADLAFASGNNSEALARYEQLLKSRPRVARTCERATIAALKLGQVARAEAHVDCATQNGTSSWRAWNARGAIFDHYGDWAGADRAYRHAVEIAPDKPEVLNNQGWSHLLRGDWQGALGYLAKAAAAMPGSERIANNLELAQVALEVELPNRRAGESAEDWAHRLNDAGVAAQLMGNRQKAVAAFTRALEASEIWYARAANNLNEASAAK